MDSSDSGSVVADTYESDDSSVESIGDNFTLKLYVTFKKSMKRFVFSCCDELSTLEDEVARRFQLDGEGLRLKYWDEANELISICCDEDLKLALDTLGSNKYNSMNLIYEKAF